MSLTLRSTDNYQNRAFSICNSAFIFESFGDPNPKTDIICGPSSINWSYYRKIPETATKSASSSSSSTSSSPSPTPIPPERKPGSKVWIAGAVAGPVVGIALIAGIVFFLMRRKKRNNQDSRNSIPQVGGAIMGPPSGVQSYTDAKPQISPDSFYTQSSPGLNDYFSPQSIGQQPYSPQSAYGVQSAKLGHTTAESHAGPTELGAESRITELPSEQARK